MQAKPSRIPVEVHVESVFSIELLLDLPFHYTTFSFISEEVALDHRQLERIAVIEHVVRGDVSYLSNVDVWG